MNKIGVFLGIFCLGLAGYGQQGDDAVSKEAASALKESVGHTWDANKELSENNFTEAEVAYRRAISKSKENGVAPYNLANSYYNREKYNEAFGRYKEAGEAHKSKEGKHKAFHNMGNVFMQKKDYQQAVDAYKEALRSNPKDEETRYNLALAKEMLKKDQENNNNEDQDEEQQDQNEQNEQNQDQDQNGDQGENQDQQEDQSQGDQQQEEQNQKGEGDQKQEENKKPEQGEQENQQQPRPNQLSPQQIENLLEAMENEEKKVQEKMDAKKVKGKPTKKEKDW